MLNCRGRPGLLLLLPSPDIRSMLGARYSRFEDFFDGAAATSSTRWKSYPSLGPGRSGNRFVGVSRGRAPIRPSPIPLSPTSLLQIVERLPSGGAPSGPRGSHQFCSLASCLRAVLGRCMEWSSAAAPATIQSLWRLLG